MKLLYIANARFPTEKVHGMQVAKMAEAFHKIGVEVELIVPLLPAGGRDLVKFYGLNLEKPPVIRRIPTWPWRGTRFSYIISTFIFGIISAAYAACRRGIIYSLDLDHFSFFLMPFVGKPYFFEMHSPGKNDLPHRLLFSKISGVMATSESTRRSLIECFPRLKDRTMIAPSGGIDAELYERTAPQEMEHPAVVYTGSFQEWKGLDTALEAARLAPDIHWYFVGDRAKLLGDNLPQNVRVVPWGPSPRAAGWQKGADVLLLSGTNRDAYSSRFTSPMKTFEYMAAGRPICAARTPAIAQVVSNKEVFFYEPDNAGDLVRAVRSILSRPNEVRQKVERARSRALSFTWEHRAREIIDFLRSTLGVV